MRKGHLSSAVAVFMLVSHFGVIPFIYLYASRFNSEDRMDIILLIGPMTTAYMVTILKYVIGKAEQKNSDTPMVNLLYVVFSIVIPVFFIFSIYFTVHLMQIGKISDVEVAKKMVGVIEILIGGIFAMMIEDLFK